jgi:hypothetical protein
MNRSQSAVSEPTRLSVPFEAMSSGLNPNRVSLSASTGDGPTLPSPIGWESGWG